MLIAQPPNGGGTGDSYYAYNLLAAAQRKVEDQSASIHEGLVALHSALRSVWDLVPVRTAHNCTVLEDVYRLGSSLGNAEIQGLHSRTACREDGASYRPAMNVRHDKRACGDPVVVEYLYNASGADLQESFQIGRRGYRLCQRVQDWFDARSQWLLAG